MCFSPTLVMYFSFRCTQIERPLFEVRKNSQAAVSFDFAISSNVPRRIFLLLVRELFFHHKPARGIDISVSEHVIVGVVHAECINPVLLFLIFIDDRRAPSCRKIRFPSVTSRSRAYPCRSRPSGDFSCSSSFFSYQLFIVGYRHCLAK